MSGVVFHSLHCGSCTAHERLIHRQGLWDCTCFPAGCAVIEHHREGVFLIDTGYSPRFFDATKPFPERLYRWATPVELKPSDFLHHQLKEKGICPSDLRKLILTHLHADHISGARDLAEPPCLFHPEALLGMKGSRTARVRKGFLPSLMPDESNWDRMNAFRAWHAGLRAAPVTPDQRILIIDLPGHAPGHCGVYIETDTGPVLFAADAAWFHHEFTTPLQLTRLAKGILWNPEAYVETQQKIRTLREEISNLHIVLSHQSEVAA